MWYSLTVILHHEGQNYSGAVNKGDYLIKPLDVILIRDE